MAFYGERFHRPDDEEIWEDLRYWLKNPITQEEQTEREQEINNYVNAVLDRVFKD